MAGHVEAQLVAPEPFEAMLCVEVVRACGLQAAVNEASLWLGGGIFAALSHLHPGPLSSRCSLLHADCLPDSKHSMLGSTCS